LKSRGPRQSFAWSGDFNFEKGLFWAFLATLVWIPIPLGSNRPWAWAVLEIAAYLLFALWMVLWSLGKARVSDPLRRAWPALVLLAGVIALHLIQIVPLPP